jgi:hypothetical protein
MICILTIVRYPKFFGWAGFLSMAAFRMPLMLNKKISFWKLMGCGKNGTFDKIPDWRQWAVLQVCTPLTIGDHSTNNKRQITDFSPWWKFFRCEVLTFVLEPIEGHGTWDKQKCFGELPKQTEYEGLIGVLTRATIRVSKLKSFWKNVEGVSGQMRIADGFITSLGIGEMPWIKQATFSIWQNKTAMKQFAYQMKEHAEVIRKTRQDNWYSEEMFVRFKILASFGSLHGKNPLAGKL